MLLPSLGVSSLTWAALRGGLFSASELHQALPPGCVVLKETAMFAPALSFAKDTAMLALEAQTVIGIRLPQLACGGPEAEIEAHRMVTEKVSALGEAASHLASGGSIHEVVKAYRGHVQANVRRLTS